MIKIKQLIKNWLLPAGKYITTDDFISCKGETKDELFIRRDNTIQERVNDSYPIMRYSDYMALHTTGTSIRRFHGDPIDNLGAVYDVEANKIKIFRLV